MTASRRAILAGVVLAAAGAALFTFNPAARGQAPSGSLPPSLTDQEFWRLSTEASESGGTFHSDNFVSNEGLYQTVIPELLEAVPQHGVYIGVGPEQNFTYISALHARMAFIVDVRRGNLHEHLLYKALFEMSADRAEFLARLFVQPKPAGVGPESTLDEIFAALGTSQPTEASFREHLAAVRGWLTKRHSLPLDAADLEGIAYVYRSAFFADGPNLNYRLTGRGGRDGGTPTYAQLMMADDGHGERRSYLSTEARYRVVRALHEKNLIVPVVGDFGGPKALRAVGRYARQHGATVSAFYLSNVEQYLRQDGKTRAFCNNVASMPLDERSTFIRSVRGGGGGGGGFARFRSSLGRIGEETRACAGPSTLSWLVGR